MLRAGAAKVDVSPRKPEFLVGYPHVPRVSTGVHDPLWASALYISDGARQAIVVGVDILFVHHETAAACRAAISARTGVPDGAILISATHTHSGPVTGEMLAWRDDPVVPPPDPDYMRRFEAGIVSAAEKAWSRAEPAEAAWTVARVDGVGGNRLAKDGLRDAEAGVLAVRRVTDGQMLAVNVVYSMHPTVLHEDSTLVSADFPGAARARIEAACEGAVLIYHTGPSGNQSPRYWVSGQTFDESDRLGGLLGERVVAALSGLDGRAYRADATVDAEAGRVNLPARRFLDVKTAEANLARARAEFERLKREGAPHGPVRTAECAVFGAEEAVVLATAQANGELEQWRSRYMPARVQAVRVGGAYLAGLPGECFVEYGLEIKKRAGVPAAVISLAGGELQGYIVTPEADAAGGYEAACSFFRPESGMLMVDEAVRLIGVLRARV